MFGNIDVLVNTGHGYRAAVEATDKIRTFETNFFAPQNYPMVPLVRSEKVSFIVM